MSRCFDTVAQNRYSTVRLRVGAFDVGVLVFSAAAIFLASVHGKCLRYTEDVGVVFTKKNSSLLTLERGRWIRMLCDSSNLHKQKLVRPKPLASKMAAVKKVGQTNGEVGLLVEYLFCDRGKERFLFLYILLIKHFTALHLITLPSYYTIIYQVAPCGHQTRTYLLFLGQIQPHMVIELSPS